MTDDYIDRTNPFEGISRTVSIVVFSIFVLAALIIIFSSGGGFQTAKVIQNTQVENVHNIKLTDKGFVPDLAYVNVGDAIKWQNKASTPHTVTSDYWGSELLFPGDEYLLIITEVKEYDYFSIDNKSLRGKIVVIP